MEAEELIQLALKSPKVQKAIGGREIEKVIYIKDKLINFVLKGD